MSKLKEFRSKWAGRKFKCEETEEEFVIPENVERRQFFKVGNGFVDVGDGYYCRFGGKIEEVK